MKSSMRAAVLLLWCLFAPLLVLGQNTVYISAGDNIQSHFDSNPAGTTFILGEGIHRSQRINVGKSHIQFIGEEGAIMSGAVVLTNWTFADGFWTAPATPAPSAMDTTIPCKAGIRCNNLEQLFMDDVLLTHVTSLLEVDNATEWYFNYTTNVVFTKADPTGKLAEFSNNLGAFVALSTGTNITIKNLIIEKYATPTASGTVGWQNGGVNWRIEDCEIRYNHGMGLHIANRSSIVRSKIHHNGQFGLRVKNSDSLIEANEISYNGDGGYTMSENSVYAGGVIAGGGGNTFRNNHAHHNIGDGFIMHWCRLWGVNVYESNLIEWNDKTGIYFRDSSNGTVIRNIIRNNGRLSTVWFWGSQVLIRNSQTIQVMANHITIDASFGNAVTMVWQILSNPFDETIHNAVLNNHITFLGARGLVGGVSDLDPYPPIHRPEGNNTFNANIYHVSSPSHKYVKWDFTDLSIGEWQSFRYPEEFDAQIDTDVAYTDAVPEVSIVSPSNGTLVNVSTPSFTVSVSASDDLGVHAVRVLLDGVVVATSYTSPFDFTIDSATLNGKSSAALTVVVVDVGRKITTSAPVTLLTNSATSGATTGSATTSAESTTGGPASTSDTTGDNIGSPSDSESEAAVLAGGAIIGIAVGGAALLAVIVAIILFAVIKRRRNRSDSASSQSEEEPAQVEMSSKMDEGSGGSILTSASSNGRQNYGRPPSKGSSNSTPASPANYGSAPVRTNNSSGSTPSSSMARADTEYGSFSRSPSDADTTVASVPARKKSTKKISVAPKANSWEISASELEFFERVGSGSFGDVFRGQWRQTQVAIKKLKTANEITSQALDEFYEELNVIKALRPHQNVVSFYGVCTSSSSSTLCLIFEFMSMGSLASYLRSNKLTRSETLRVIKGIAAGINHLHQENIVHRDIAARNVLLQKLDSQLNAKITDFGMSRVTQDAVSSNQTASTVGPLKWMSLESLRSKQYSVKSDVWSFAVCCWEILNYSEPFPDLDAFHAASKVAYDGLRLELPDQEKWPVLHDIMQKCFSDDPDQRPSMSKICQQLDFEK